MPNTPTEGDLSALVVTYNRKDALRRCLDSILHQDPPVFEIVVYDNNSTDGTAEMILEEYPQVRYVHSETNLGCPAGRNAGIAAARSRYVLCVDDDGSLREGAVRAISDALIAYPRTAVIAGLVIDDYHRYPPQIGPAPTFGFSGGICCIDRELFQELGGYHEDGLRQGEEGELAYSIYDAGRLVIRQPALILDHHVQVSAERWRAVIRSSARQTILTGIKKAPLSLLAPWLLLKQPAQIRHAAQRRSLGAYIGGIVDGLKASAKTFESRDPVSSRAILAGTRFYRQPVAKTTPTKSDDA